MEAKKLFILYCGLQSMTRSDRNNLFEASKASFCLLTTVLQPQLNDFVILAKESSIIGFICGFLALYQNDYPELCSDKSMGVRRISSLHGGTF